MGKPVAGDIVVLPFPQTNLQSGKRRPAMVVADLRGDDLILCQITSQARGDVYSVELNASDLDSGHLSVNSFVRANRLFTIENSIVLYVAAKAKATKLEEVRTAIRHLFS